MRFFFKRETENSFTLGDSKGGEELFWAKNASGLQSKNFTYQGIVTGGNLESIPARILKMRFFLHPQGPSLCLKSHRENMQRREQDLYHQRSQVCASLPAPLTLLLAW